MGSGRRTKVVGQTGEYLVAAELSRRGFIATTFTGNVPHYDIVASDDQGRHCSVQVKTSMSPNWQISDARKYVDIQFDGHTQIIGKPVDPPIFNLIMVFVVMAEYGTDRFYVMKWEDYQSKVIMHYRNNLERYDGIRPKRWDSTHASIQEQEILEYRHSWALIEDALH